MKAALYIRVRVKQLLIATKVWNKPLLSLCSPEAIYIHTYVNLFVYDIPVLFTAEYHIFQAVQHIFTWCFAMQRHCPLRKNSVFLCASICTIFTHNSSDSHTLFLFLGAFPKLQKQLLTSCWLSLRPSVCVCVCVCVSIFIEQLCVHWKGF
jgi:hypothetical protein